MSNPEPSYLSQDGGDGEKAAGAVLNGLLAVQNDPEWYRAIQNMHETAADADSVTFQFASGQTIFQLQLSRA
jgi:hypothetical protein